MPVALSDGLIARNGGFWTREKLTYFERYAHAFMTAMAPKRAEGKWQRLVFIDLLCGPGIDLIEGEEHQGSPLIALTTTPQFDRLFFGDLAPANIVALQARIPAADADRVDVQAGDCHARAQQVVAQLASWGELGFAFVDPEGFEVRFDLFTILGQRPIDILFLFPSGIGIKRNLARFARRTDETPMDRLWGNREWRQTPIVRLLAGETLTQPEAEQLDQSWVQAFRDRVATLGYTYHDAAPPLRNEQNVPMYHLLFFSKNKAGLDIWRGIGRIEPGGQRRLW
jgi:three-Cys-motif partner protein